MVEWHRDNRGSETDGVDNVALTVDHDDDDSESSDDDDDSTTCSSLAVAQDGGETSRNANIAVASSSDVHFGNKTFYQGPVTIKQYVYPSGPEVSRLGLESPRESLPIDLVPESCCRDIQKSAESEVRLSHSVKKDVSLRNEGGEEIKVKPGASFIDLKWRRIGCFLIAVVVACVVFATVFGVLMKASIEDVELEEEGAGSTSSSATTIITSPPDQGMCLMQPSDWSSRPSPDYVGRPLQQPVPYVIISHTAGSTCSTSLECMTLVRNIQTYHASDLKWGEIGYNFLVGGDGCVYVGRGWDSVGAHSYGYNSCSIGISFMGTFSTYLPTKGQMDALRVLMAQGVRLGKIRPDFRLLGHRQVITTSSPGEALFMELKKMEHFSEKVLKCSIVVKDMDDAMSVVQNSTTVI